MPNIPKVASTTSNKYQVDIGWKIHAEIKTINNIDLQFSREKSVIRQECYFSNITSFSIKFVGCKISYLKERATKDLIPSDFLWEVLK